MSRSRKKNPIITDTSKSAKKISHHKFRKRVKQKIKEQRFDEIPDHERETINQWDVCDWRFGWYEKEEREYSEERNESERKFEKRKRSFRNK